MNSEAQILFSNNCIYVFYTHDQIIAAYQQVLTDLVTLDLWGIKLCKSVILHHAALSSGNIEKFYKFIARQYIDHKHLVKLLQLLQDLVVSECSYSIIDFADVSVII